KAAQTSYNLVEDAHWGAYALGLVALERQELDKAEEWQRKAHERDKSFAPANAALAKVLSLKGDLADAADLLKNLHKVTDARALLNAGQVLMKAERYRQARDAYQRALALMEKVGDANRDEQTQAEAHLTRADAWVDCEGLFESIRDLPPKSQVGRIIAKFGELKPAWQPSHRHGRHIHWSAKDGVLSIVRVQDNSKTLQFLQPFHGLPLKSLNLWDCRGITDLSPLKGMPLEQLYLFRVNITDLSPLRGMPLTYLDLRGYDHQRALTDLSPLRGMPLETLLLTHCDATDLSPLAGMPLKKLDLSFGPSRDLSPLNGMPLEELTAGVNSLEPLRGLPLKKLAIGGRHWGRSSAFDDLSPLEGMPLKSLSVRGNTRVSDL
ncbi:MAG: hypothetical protein QF886_25835, partial [Planctomycetota bacterium]|nr:hypothetical protein [Planctomycetota bacterium]